MHRMKVNSTSPSYVRKVLEYAMKSYLAREGHPASMVSVHEDTPPATVAVLEEMGLTVTKDSDRGMVVLR